MGAEFDLATNSTKDQCFQLVLAFGLEENRRISVYYTSFGGQVVNCIRPEEIHQSDDRVGTFDNSRMGAVIDRKLEEFWLFNSIT